jgi:heat shock protein HslJ
MTEIHRAVALATATVLLAGCSLLPGGTSASLDGKWQLQTGTNQGQQVPVVPGSQVTLVLNGTQAGGTAACNSFGGKIQASGTSISISELLQTEMACLDDRLMASEAAYLAALPRVTTAVRSGNSLVLSGPQVELRFALVPPVANAALIGTAWVLNSLISGDAVSSTVGARATLQFNADGTFSGSTGCRDISGHFTISGNQVQATLDPYDTIGCAQGLGDQDVHVLGVISDGFSVTIQGQSLTLTAGTKGLGYQVGS